MNIWRYKVPYTKPLILKGKEYTHREGLIVKMKGFGEIAPLPGFSRETLEEAQEELLSKRAPTLPSVKFGLLSALKEPASFSPLPISKLLWGTKEEILQAPIQGECKVKVSSFSIVDTVDLISTLKKRYPKVKLRIDVNQKWTLEEALFFSSHFNKEDFAYLEEPVRSFEELVQFSKITSFPIAADETLLTQPMENILALPSLTALVIKPSIYHLTTKVPCKIIYSSSLETSIGLEAIQLLAHSNRSKEALGIDTAHLLNEKEMDIWPVFSAL